MQRGTQILYIPTHAAGDSDHPDVESGVVTSVRGDVAFCRYWYKERPRELRTKANSEATPLALLVERDTCPRYVIKHLLRALEAMGLE